MTYILTVIHSLDILVGDTTDEPAIVKKKEEVSEQKQRKKLKKKTKEIKLRKIILFLILMV